MIELCNNCKYTETDTLEEPCLSCERLPNRPAIEMESSMRQFDTGATRNVDSNKLDYEGFLSPSVLKRYAEYLNKHRVQADGQIRDSDNWQKGIPMEVYMKSMWRHFHDMWSQHRGIITENDLEESICAVIFNASGYLFEKLKTGPSPDPRNDK